MSQDILTTAVTGYRNDFYDVALLYAHNMDTLC